MAKSRKALREEVKAMYIETLIDVFTERDEDVLRVKSNEIALPVVDAEGNEDFIVIKVSIPTGANKGADPYDGYSEAEFYERKEREKKAKAKELAEKKARKIEKDKKRREKEAEIHSKERD